MRRIWNWLFGKGGSWDLYHPGERLIYKFHNGGRVIHADPMPLYSKIMAEAGDLQIEMKVANFPGHPEADKFHNIVVTRLRGIFGIEPRTGIEVGNTLTDGEVIDLFNHFMDFHAQIKKNWKPAPISAEGMPGASSFSSAESPPTANGTGSGPTGDESSTASPSPSTSESSQPSGSPTPA